MEIAKQILHEKQVQLFKSQDPAEEFFDVVFEIDGKKLYADKFRLAATSTTFRSMLSQRWNSKNEPIKIEGNNYEDFKEFLTFLYSGECNLTDKNIFAIIEIAEFYNVEVLTNICDEYASKMEISNENAFQMLELAIKYSLKELKKTTLSYFQSNFADLTASDKFLSFDGTSIEELVIIAENIVKPENIFEAVYNWAENQAKLKNAASNGDNLNLNDAIKNELSELLPHIQFRKMKLEFLHKFVVPKAFIFPSFQELSDILSYVASNSYPAKVTVKAIGPYGEILEGTLPHHDPAIKDIKSIKNSLSTKGCRFIYWDRTCFIPSTPSQLKLREGVDWYLVYFSDPCWGVIHRSKLNSHYLVAEMFCENEVKESDGWKIEVV